jgi:hypothetical protein
MSDDSETKDAAPGGAVEKQSGAWTSEDFVAKVVDAVKRGMAMGLDQERAIEHALVNWNMVSQMQRYSDLTPEEVAEVRRLVSGPGIGPTDQQAALSSDLLEQYAQGQITQTEMEQRIARGAP